MKPQDIELLLLLTLILLFTVSFYALRFWLKLRKAARENRKIVVLQTLPIQTDLQTTGGVAFFPWFLLIVLAFIFVALYG